mgnify:CR=1 FL=1
MVLKIASLSRLSPERGIKRLIKAMSLVKSEVECFIGGDGIPSYRKKLLNLCDAYGVRDKVHFVGTITSPMRFLKDKIIVVNPILIKTGEEYGFSDLEVLLNKKALIRSWDKTQKVLRHLYNVYHVNPVPEEIAAAIDFLIDHPEIRKRLEINGYLTVQRLNRLAIKQHYIFYKKLLET